jgi:hypothetical protein
VTRGATYRLPYGHWSPVPMVLLRDRWGLDAMDVVILAVALGRANKTEARVFFSGLRRWATDASTTPERVRRTFRKLWRNGWLRELDPTPANPTDKDRLPRWFNDGSRWPKLSLAAFDRDMAAAWALEKEAREAQKRARPHGSGGGSAGGSEQVSVRKGSVPKGSDPEGSASPLCLPQVSVPPGSANGGDDPFSDDGGETEQADFDSRPF